VINDATRKRLFGDGSALGRMLEVDGQRFKIVGVVPNIPLPNGPVRDVPSRSVPQQRQQAGADGRIHGDNPARTKFDLPGIGGSSSRWPRSNSRIRSIQPCQKARRRCSSPTRASSSISSSGVGPRVFSASSSLWRALHGATDTQSREPQREQNPRAGVGDRRPQGVRSLPADARRPVRLEKRSASPGRSARLARSSVLA
jgi:hypothetical protein